MADPFDEALASPAGPGLLAEITRLYLVVQGRPPDPGGLRAYVAHRQAGLALRDLAAAFLASDEFSRQLGRDRPEAVLCRNALGPQATPEAHGWPAAALPDFAAALVSSPEAARRLPVLPALYPDGLPLRTAADYRIWLAGRPAVPAPADGPRVSFIMPDLRPGAESEATLRSALALGWPGLEVVVCAWRFGRALRRAAKADRRLRLLRTPFWYDPGQRFNHGLFWCRGVFAGLLESGDRLDAGAAAPVAAALAQADIVLSDEDAIDPAGLRHSPRFGAGWDPDRVLATGQAGPLLARRSVLRRAVLRLAGGWRVETGAADLLLRAARQVPPERIVHVPAVWVSRPARAAADPGAAVLSAEAYLAASGQGDAVVIPGPGVLRVVHPLPQSPPTASIVIATRNRAELLSRCTDGLLDRTDYPALEIVIVDNGSDEAASVALLRRLARDPRVRVLSRPGPFNWAALSNAGVAGMAGEVAVLLNNDTDVIEPGWLREMVSQAVRPDVGAVGARLLYPDGSVQHAGMVLDGKGHALHMWRRSAVTDAGYLDSLRVVREVTAVTGACLATRRAVFDAVGGCDAGNLPVTWNDIDLCLRVRAHGKRVLWTPHACLLHLEQASRGSDDTPATRARFRREQAWMRQRWGEALDRDPFLSPNLLYSETELRLSSHPRA